MRFAIMSILIPVTFVLYAQVVLAQTEVTETPMTYVLKSEDGTDITIQSTKRQVVHSGDSVWVFATNTKVEMKRKGKFNAKNVGAVLVEVCEAFSPGKGTFGATFICEAKRTAQDTFSANVSSQDCRIEGSAMNVKYLKGLQGILVSANRKSGTDELCRQEIAIVVDGQWLKDPVNGTNNFRVQF